MKVAERCADTSPTSLHICSDLFSLRMRLNQSTLLKFMSITVKNTINCWLNVNITLFKKINISFSFLFNLNSIFNKCSSLCIVFVRWCKFLVCGIDTFFFFLIILRSKRKMRCYLWSLIFEPDPRILPGHGFTSWSGQLEDGKQADEKWALGSRNQTCGNMK